MRKEPTINGLEQDVVYARRIYCYLHNNPSLKRFAKRCIRRRSRRKAKLKLKSPRD